MNPSNYSLPKVTQKTIDRTVGTMETSPEVLDNEFQTENPILYGSLLTFEGRGRFPGVVFTYACLRYQSEDRLPQVTQDTVLCAIADLGEFIHHFEQLAEDENPQLVEYFKSKEDWEGLFHMIGTSTFLRRQGEADNLLRRLLG